MIQQPDGIPRDKAAEGVPDNAQLPDRLSVAGQPLQLFLNLLSDALTSGLDTVVSIGAGIAGNDEDMELVFGEGVTEGGGQIGKMVRVTPESAACESARQS